MGICNSTKDKHQKTFNNQTQVKQLKPIQNETSFFIEKDEKKSEIETVLLENKLKDLKKLIESGEIDVNSKVTPQYSLLLYCVVKGIDVDLIKYLLEMKANIEEVEPETGNTPIFFAGLNLNEEVFHLLVSKKCNMKHVNFRNESIYMYMIRSFEGYFDEENEEKRKYESILNVINDYQ